MNLLAKIAKMIEFYYFSAILALPFVCHDIEYHVIGSSHGVCTNTCEIVDAAVHIVVDDAFCTTYTLAFH